MELLLLSLIAGGKASKASMYYETSTLFRLIECDKRLRLYGYHSFPAMCAGNFSSCFLQEQKCPTRSNIKMNCHLAKTSKGISQKESQNGISSLKRSYFAPDTKSPNLLKPHNPPLSLIAILNIRTTALPLLIPTLPSLLRLSRTPLAELMLALLAARLSDRRRRSETNTVDTFAVIAESSVDLMAGDFRVLPGRVGFPGGLAAVW
jgi:hypothetical protein